MSAIRLDNGARGVIVLGSAVALALTVFPADATASVRGRGLCNEAEVRRIVYAFTAAFNRGDEKRLSALWATQAHFKWYSVGRSPKQHYVTYARAAMLRYFAARHRRRETLSLSGWKFNGVSGGHGHFEYALMRRANDLAAGDPEPYHGKGAASCAGITPRLAVWSMGRDSTG